MSNVSNRYSAKQAVGLPCLLPLKDSSRLRQGFPNESTNQDVENTSNPKYQRAKSMKFVSNKWEFQRHIHRVAIRPLFPGRIGIWKCRFLWREENRSTRKKTARSKEENQQQTQPTNGVNSGNRTQATLMDGSHHCAIPAPLTDRAYTRLPFSKVQIHS